MERDEEAAGSDPRSSLRHGLQGHRPPPGLDLQEDARQAVRRRLDHGRLLPRPGSAWPRRRSGGHAAKTDTAKADTAKAADTEAKNSDQAATSKPATARGDRASASAEALASSSRSRRPRPELSVASCCDERHVVAPLSGRIQTRPRLPASAVIHDHRRSNLIFLDRGIPRIRAARVSWISGSAGGNRAMRHGQGWTIVIGAVCSPHRLGTRSRPAVSGR